MSATTVAPLAAPAELPCGLKLPNRLVKPALEEMLSKAGGGPPSVHHQRLYSQWGNGGFGLIITGNVMVSPRCLGTPFDVVYDPHKDVPHPRSEWSEWAKACRSGPVRTPTVVQLCHPGRQSSRGSGRPPWEPSLAPSARGLSLGKGVTASVMSKVAFGTPKAMTKKDIDATVQQFKNAAKGMHAAGFDGVQIHCSHGYLLAQFISPEANKRTDEYGATPKDRLRLLFEIIDAIRKEVPPTFCVGLKLNSADYVAGGLTEDDALENVKWITEHGGVDFIEISGGTYENGAMLADDSDTKTAEQGSKSNGAPRQNRREAFFQDFASRAHAHVRSLPKADSSRPPLIMLTGGFRTRKAMSSAVATQATDLVGLGRPSCVKPDLPKLLLDEKVADDQARSPLYEIKGKGLWKVIAPIAIIGPGLNTLWHTWQLQRIGMGRGVDLQLTILGGILDSIFPRSLISRLVAFFSALFALRFILLR